MINIRLDPSQTTLPLYRQIAEQLGWQITQGELRQGDPLPPTRELARQLCVSRGSVVRAYELLVDMALCRSHVGRGTFVAACRESPLSSSDAVPDVLQAPNEPISVDPRQLSLLPSLASVEFLPIGELRRAFSRVLRYPSRLGQFGESAGDPALRRLICDVILPARGIVANPSQVMIVPGSQYGSVLLALTLMKTHSSLHFGVPGYLDIARNFARFGFELVPHDMDKQGICDVPCRGGDRDIFYIMPEHHFPQCVTLDPERRERLMSLARVSNMLIVEDDYDSEFYYDRMPQPALKANDDTGSVIYLGTFSKALFNSLRLGYIVADEQLVSKLASLHWSLSRGTSLLLQRWVAELIADGTYERHVNRMRTAYRHKRNAMARLLQQYFPAAEFDLPTGGLQFLLRCSSREKVVAISQWCAANNIHITTPDIYLYPPNERSEHFLVIGFANVSLEQLEGILVALKDHVDSF